MMVTVTVADELWNLHIRRHAYLSKDTRQLMRQSNEIHIKTAGRMSTLGSYVSVHIRCHT